MAMMIRGTEAVENVVAEIRQEVDSFLDYPPIDNPDYISQDMVVDSDNPWRIVFRPIEHSAPPSQDVLYRHVRQPSKFPYWIDNVVARWYDLDAWNVVADIYAGFDTPKDNPYHDHDFTAVDGVKDANGAGYLAPRELHIPVASQEGWTSVYEYMLDAEAENFGLQWRSFRYPDFSNVYQDTAKALIPQVHDILKGADKEQLQKYGSNPLQGLPIRIAALALVEQTTAKEATMSYLLDCPAELLPTPRDKYHTDIEVATDYADAMIASRTIRRHLAKIRNHKLHHNRA